MGRSARDESRTQADRDSCDLFGCGAYRLSLSTLKIRSIVRDNSQRDLRAQLHQLFFGKLFSQTRIQIVRNIRGGITHRISQFNDEAFGVIE
jgi:hypothetical protein